MYHNLLGSYKFRSIKFVRIIMNYYGFQITNCGLLLFFKFYDGFEVGLMLKEFEIISTIVSSNLIIMQKFDLIIRIMKYGNIVF